MKKDTKEEIKFLVHLDLVISSVLAIMNLCGVLMGMPEANWRAVFLPYLFGTFVATGSFMLYGINIGCSKLINLVSDKVENTDYNAMLNKIKNKICNIFANKKTTEVVQNENYSNGIVSNYEEIKNNDDVVEHAVSTENEYLEMLKGMREEVKAYQNENTETLGETLSLKPNIKM